METNWASVQLCDLPANLKSGSVTNSGLRCTPVNFRSPNCLSSKFDGGSISFDIPCLKSAQILRELENVVEISTQLYCRAKPEARPEIGVRQNGKRQGKQSQSWCLNIIIFGRESIREKVGEYLSRHKKYLQDPLGCERCVPYRNPHIMDPVPDLDETVMADSFSISHENIEIERLQTGPDLLSQLMRDDISLAETEAPDNVKTPLYP
jgi:hypothetical protein